MKSKLIKRVTIGLFLTIAPATYAQHHDQNNLEAEVTITKKQTSTIEEFRRNGVVVMIKITPKHGYPYYLVDSDGDGSLETKRNQLDDPELIRWEIFRW